MNNNGNVPNHVAIIPDGNRRWAKENELDPWDGHDKGAQMIEKIVKASRDKGVKYISFWGSSIENMNKRSLKERGALINIYEKYFTKLIAQDDVFDEGVRINIFGNWKTQLPKKIVKILEEGVEKTKTHDKFFLNFFLAYSGDEEMLQAVQNIAINCNDGAKITKETIKEHLFTRDLPPVDYLIRTGGDPHLSAGFMMWDIANAQLFFSDKYFPNFDDVEFIKSIDEYALRARRLGA